MNIRRNEIINKRITLAVDDKLSITNGTFERKKEGIRVRYQRDESTNDVNITIDARRLPRVQSESKWTEDKNRSVLELEIEENNNPIPCLLSIELGNSRTMATLIDDYQNSRMLNFYSVKFRHDTREESGDLSSLISFINPEDFDEECRLSFVKIGKLAEYNAFLINKEHSGEYMLSSPKRYYWDNDPVARGWKAIAENGNTRKLESFLAAKISKESLSKADMLCGIIAEIYEQACYYLYNDFPREVRTHKGEPRYINAIHITYPSAMNSRELEKYREKLEYGLKKYLGIFEGTPNVELFTDVDEASAVLAFYVYSEIINARSAKFFLKNFGKKCPGGHSLRIASIDIGGGTSDISVAEIVNGNDEGSTDAEMRLQLNFGVNKAGELLLYNLLKKELIIRAINSLRDTDIDEEQIRANYNSVIYSDDNDLKEFNVFLREMAIKVACAIENAEETSVTIPISSQKAKNFFQEVLQCREEDLDVKKIEITIDEELIKSYSRLVWEVFNDTAVLFANFIAAYQVDRVIFSGKTFELNTIYKMFKEKIALPPENIINMNNYNAGSWYNGKDGHIIKDSKQATTLGGALHLLGNLNLRFVDNNSSQPYVWTKVSRDNPDVYYEDDRLFKDGGVSEIIYLRNIKNDCLIARKLYFNVVHKSTLSFQIRFKLDIQRSRKLEGDLEIKIALNPLNNSISIDSVNGQYADGSAVKKEDLECRICSMSRESEFDSPIEI